MEDTLESGHGPSVVVIGGANIDISGKSTDPLVRHDSNPGAVRLSHGGVGRNICHNLSLLGVDVALITAFGDDRWAADLKRDCHELGIDVSQSLTLAGQSTSSYIYIDDYDGEMYCAVNDMSVLDSLTKEVLAERLGYINSAQICFVDTNLTQETIAWVCENVKVPLFSDPISCAKAPKLAQSIGRLHTMKPNRYEAEVLAGIRIKDDDDMRRASEVLMSTGLEQLFMSLGREGLYYSDGLVSEKLHLPERHIVDVTGAGDAMSAALAWAYLEGMGIDEAARAGIAASSIAVESASTVNTDLSRSLVMERMGQLF